MEGQQLTLACRKTIAVESRASSLSIKELLIKILQLAEHATYEEC